jgi:hypothetical protein
VIAELRVLPNEASQASGMWSGDPAHVPPEGVTTKVMRVVALREIRRVIERPEIVREVLSQTAAQAEGAERARIDRELDRLDERASWPATLEDERIAAIRAKDFAHRARRERRDDAYYARIASLYVDEVAKGNSRPASTLASLLGKSSTSVRDLLNDARQRGLLTVPPPGRRSGGELTRRAKALLQLKG